MLQITTRILLYITRLKMTSEQENWIRKAFLKPLAAISICLKAIKTLLVTMISKLKPAT